MKPRKLKTEIAKSLKEWLEYPEHRERWTPQARTVIDKHIKKTFPVSPADRKRAKIISDYITSHSKKPSS